mgnify:CR=1 FL=1
MRKLGLYFSILFLRLMIRYLLSQNGFNLQDTSVLRYNLILDKYVVAYQKLISPGLLS